MGVAYCLPAEPCHPQRHNIRLLQRSRYENSVLSSTFWNLKSDQFTKTGSGQIQVGKTQRKERRLKMLNAGTNEYGAAAEESGLATLPLADLPGIDHTTNISLWKRDSRSPLIKSGPKGVYYCCCYCYFRRGTHFSMEML